MSKIRGFVPGAQVSKERVVAKWHQTPSPDHRGGDVYWVTWTTDDIEVPGDHRLNLPASVWNSLEVGGPIEIVHLEPDGKPYHRQGLFASNGNFAFDLALLGVLLFVATRNLLLARL